ncbi:MAG: YlbF family regulator [Peptococcaceae bacterium]|nr:YlbF family regulator [Peptococcaceae bacterium]
MGEKVSKTSKVAEALEKCIDLGKILAQTDEYKEVKKAEQNLLHDAEARRLVENLQQLQQEHLKKQMAGIEITEEEKKRMAETERIAIQHPVVRASHMANAGFQDLMKEISSKIREGIRLYSEK